MSWTEANDALGVHVLVPERGSIEGEIAVIAANKVSLRFPGSSAPVFPLGRSVELRFIDKHSSHDVTLLAEVTRRFEFEDRRQYEFQLQDPDLLWNQLGSDALVLVNLQPNSRAQPARSEPVAVTLESDSPRIRLRGELSDISVAGIAVTLEKESGVDRVADEFAAVDLVKVSLQLPQDEAPFVIWAHVRRRSVVGDDYRYGLVFDAVRTESLATIQARIRRYVMERRREDAKAVLPRGGARTIQSKMSRAMWFVALGFISLAAITILHLGERFASEDVAARLHDGEVQWNDRSALRKLSLRRSAAAIAGNSRLEKILIKPNPDHRAAMRLARAAQRQTEVDLVIIADRGGRILANTRYPGTVRQLIEIEGGLWERLGSLYSVEGVAVPMGDSKIGMVVLGEKIDARFSDSMRRATKTDVLVVHRAGTLTGSWGEGVTQPVSAEELAPLIDYSDSGNYHRVVLAGQESFASVLPLGPNSMIVLSLSAANLMAMYWLWLLWMFGALLIFAILSFWLTRFIASRLARPIQQLTDVSCELADGNLDVSVREDGTKELAILAGSFNRMAERIQTLLVDVRRQARVVEEQRAELELASAKDDFLVTVSHELLTPLTNILSSAEILTMLGEEDQDAEAEFLEIIQHQSTRLRDLIHQLLDLARIQSGNGQWELHDLDLCDVVRAAASECVAADVSIELPEDRCSYYGDARRIRLLIDNLISNGHKFSRGERVDVRLARLEGGYELRVADQGPGVPEAEKKRIFDKFVQIGDILTDRPDGTGLGLAMCREIARAHTGEIQCEDNPSGGAVFVVEFPDYDPERPRPVDEFAEKALARVGG